MSLKEQWDVSVFNLSKIIKQLRPFTDNFKHYSEWPSVENYVNIFKRYNLSILPVPQSTSANDFEDKYESRIYLKKELQTRTENWHDFFNALVWLKFPETKKALNKLHYLESKNRKKGSNRSLLENRITQFDECGAIIVSSNPLLLELIRNHDWHELFVNQRAQFETNICCVVFGHAIFEKAISPYIGMTCHCILLDDEKILEQLKSADSRNLDLKLSHIWLNVIANNPEKLAAFPILGVPDLWPDQSVSFYSNTKYFR